MWFWPRPKQPARTLAGGTRGGTESAPPQLMEPAGSRTRESAATQAADLAREVAGVASDLHAQLDAFLGVRPNRDPLLASQQPSSAYAYPYGLFEEALDKDAHLSAICGQRKAAVLAWERRLDPADSSPAAREVQKFVERALDGIALFEQDLSELLDAVPYGLALSEIIWQREPAGWYVPVKLHARHPRRFVFGLDGAPRLLTANEPLLGEVLPPGKFIVFSHGGRFEDPYGLPALRTVWWLAYFKRQVLKFWVAYCEKFGTPTAVLTHPLSATERERRAFKRIIGSIQQETGLVVPEGVSLSLLEAQRQGSVFAYKDLIELCNREMSKALLGQTLTTEAGERGAYGLGRVHQDVRADLTRADARALEAVINGQLVRAIVDLNFPAGRRHYPRWRIEPPQARDLKLELEIDAFLAEQGLAQDTAALYARYGREAEAGARDEAQEGGE
jgi:phage gp29-like protein